MLSARNIENNEIVFDVFRLISEGAFKTENARTRIAAGDVLLTIVGTIGRAAVVPEAAGPFALQRSVAVLTPGPELLPKYLVYQLQSPVIQRYFEAKARGTAQKGVYLKTLGQTPIQVAPLDQQKRIVAEIEKQFSRLDEAVANLKRVKANFKRYKAAVLKAAVEGRLVETEAELARREGRSYVTGAQLLQRILETRRSQWQGKGKYKEPAAPDITDLLELPEGWVWASPAQLSAGEPYSLAIGPFGSSLKVSDYATSGVPLVFVRNIRAAMFGGPDTVYVSEVKAGELRAHWVATGDLLVTKMGDPPGDVCIYPAHRPPAVVTADCIKLRLGDFALTQFFAYAIESDLVHKQILGITKGVAQLKVSLGRFGSIAFPLPPIAEQHRIVSEVDRHLSIISKTEVQVDANLQRAEHMRQAILGKAFSARQTEYVMGLSA
ncbi:type I restriction-modification system, specificity subunit S [Sulfuriferula multivorans]|uniref:Type I restriction-modification system, specificity subunit S n=2 Tax=Sulfuriferula multivorans TaxID=1559896 RepID=A0A401JDM1_9PROT|nr:type I restriction-modification system, specificity subunit S [Sulfuriferula multivorans]